MSLNIVILAAGQGTRMLSDRPKVLHAVAHAPLLHHAMASAADLGADRVTVVVGPDAGEVAAAAHEADPAARIVVQAERLGTGHAVAQAADALSGTEGDTIVLYADTPLIRTETLEAMRAARAGHDVVVLGFEAADPGRYGRLVMDGPRLARIVEHKDATPEERAITLCNSGVICAGTDLLLDLVAAIGNDNNAGEYYLTDIVALANARGLSCGVVPCDEAETLGVNSRADLAAAEAAYQARARAAALADGATLTAPETVFFAFDTVLGRDVTVEQNVVFGPGVTAETGSTIRAFSHLEGCHISRGSIVGPYARLRPGAELEEDTRVGNFVEIKAARVGAGTKINHLTYIGDADIGPATNVGAGTVTCNYDGAMKHRTVIGARAFIGSDTMLVAPVTVGDDAMTASGSVITENVPAGALGLGRARQTNKADLGRKIMDRIKAAKKQMLERLN